MLGNGEPTGIGLAMPLIRFYSVHAGVVRGHFKYLPLVVHGSIPCVVVRYCHNFTSSHQTFVRFRRAQEDHLGIDLWETGRRDDYQKPKKKNEKNGIQTALVSNKANAEQLRHEIECVSKAPIHSSRHPGSCFLVGNWGVLMLECTKIWH